MSKERRQEEVRSGRHRENTEETLAIGGFAIILVLGGALMVVTIGTGPASIGIAIVVVFIGVFVLLYQGLSLLERWLRKD